jgi:hypothetical protein
MMFPSTDLFSYSNQPITTLESQHYTTDGAMETNQLMGRDSNGNSMFMSNEPTTGTPYDGLEVQLFGGPMYLMMQGQQANLYTSKQNEGINVGGVADIADEGESGGFPLQGRPPRDGGGAPEAPDNMFGVEVWNGTMADPNLRLS